ncbi:MAG: hypothetical protein ACOYM2_17125 [Rectinemataceae bacterium]
MEEQKLKQGKTLKGRPVTFWVEEERLNKLDEACEAFNCSRSWLLGKVIDNFDVSELIGTNTNSQE